MWSIHLSPTIIFSVKFPRLYACASDKEPTNVSELPQPLFVNKKYNPIYSSNRYYIMLTKGHFVKKEHSVNKKKLRQQRDANKLKVYSDVMI